MKSLLMVKVYTYHTNIRCYTLRDSVEDLQLSQPLVLKALPYFTMATI